MTKKEREIILQIVRNERNKRHQFSGDESPTTLARVYLRGWAAVSEMAEALGVSMAEQVNYDPKED